MILRICLEELHRHPRELRGVIGLEELKEIIGLRSLEYDERPKHGRR